MVDELNNGSDKNQAAKDTIQKEQFWFTLTMVTINGLLFNAMNNCDSNKLDIGVVGICILVTLNIYAIHLLLDRANTYQSLNRDNKRLPWLSNFLYVLDELSGSLFYILLVVNSCAAVVFCYFSV